LRLPAKPAARRETGYYHFHYHICLLFVEFAEGYYRRPAGPRSRDRTPTQLGLLERFHRTLKTEDVYWQVYQYPQQARQSLAQFRQRYNSRRPHWALIPDSGGDPLVPEEVSVDLHG